MLEHGGDLRAYARRYGIPLERWLDLSTGINPDGWPVPALDAACWQRLPELEDGLEEAARDYYGVTSLLPAAGSQALIQALPRLWNKRGTVGVLSPAYAEHEQAWRMAGHTVVRVADEELTGALEHLSVLVVVNPNNPTGRVVPRRQLLAWRELLAARGGLLLVDEAFMDVDPAQSLMTHVGRPGLAVLRSLGKFFGLAGARVGFLMAEAAWMEQVQHYLGPWSVPGPSRMVAAGALADRRWIERSRVELKEQGLRLRMLMSQYGLTPDGGTALFQWRRLADSAALRHSLAEHGVLIRAFEDPSSVRFGLPGGEGAWQRLERVLSEIPDGVKRAL
ncbi:MAG: threonine-phosphate decarboxylase [Magnetococcales bacterium]|nr:threonine-phosphate decarboxylase [Magnetococcales bacterium]